MKAHINNSLIAQIKVRPQTYDIRDTKLTGFVLRVNSSGKYDSVLYLAPEEIVRALENLFRQTTEVPVNGTRIAVNRDHHLKFSFHSFDDFL